MSRSARTLIAALALAAAGGAAAHTGHGHDSLSLVQALRHAVGEPDHLLMLAFGLGLTTAAAAPVLRGLRRLWLTWRTCRASLAGKQRATAADPGR